MKLKKLELFNFCQHEHLDIDISNGLTGILGPNGSGKSNLIQGLIYAITGTAANNLEHYIRKGSDGTSWVKLVFYSDLTGMEYTISRSIKPRKAELQCAAIDLVIRKAKDVDAYLTDVLKIDFNIVRNVLAVNQEDFVAFLRSTASERAALLMRLFGFMEFKTAREAFRQALLESSSDKDYSAELKAKKELLEMEERSLEPYKDIPDKEQITKAYKDYQSKLSEVNALINLYKTRDYFNKQSEQISQNIAVINAQLTEIGEVADVSELEKDRDNFQTSLQLVTKQFNSAVEFDKAVSDYTQKQHRLFEERDNLEQLKLRCISDEDYEKLLSQHRFLQETIANLERCAETGCCPTCGQQFPNLEQKLSSAKEEFAKVNSDYEIQRGRREMCAAKNHVVLAIMVSLSDALNNLRNWSSPITNDPDCQKSVRCENRLYMLLSNFLGSYTSIETAISTDFLALIKNTVEYLRNCVAYYTKKFNEAASQLAPMKERANKYSEFQTQLNIYKRQLQDIEDHTPTITKSMGYDMSYEEATVFVAASEKKQAEYIQLFETFSRVDAINGRIGQLKDSIRQLEDLVDKDTDRINYQNAVREAYDVLHPDALPKAVMIGLLEMLATNINYYLSLFDSPFTVSINPDSTELMCTFGNENTFVASELSGGQKMVLAISWRLALHNTFSSEESCGFITLDEPTNHLDANNIQNLTQVMSQVKQAAEDKNLQVLVITHEAELEPLFDSVIRL